MAGTVYIVTNRPNGTLYLGVTTNLGRRIWEHKRQIADGFTKRYGLTALVGTNTTMTSELRSSAKNS